MIDDSTVSQQDTGGDGTREAHELAPAESTLQEGVELMDKPPPG